jgi:tetratricopeptide (TPR) repeat protein
MTDLKGESGLGSLGDALACDDFAASSAWVREAASLDKNDLLLAFEREVRAALDDYSLEGTIRLLRIKLLFQECSSFFEALDAVEMLKIIETEALGPASVGGRGTSPIVGICNFRGSKLAEARHFDEAIAHFNEALRLDDGFVPAYCNRARCFLEREDLPAAIHDAGQIEARDPAYLPGQETIGLVRTFERLRATRRESIASLAHVHGLTTLMQQYDRPVASTRELMQRNARILTIETTQDASRTAADLNHEGVMAGRQGNYQQAIELFGSAVEREPAFADAWYNRGKTYRLWGLPAEAISDFTQAIKIDSSHGDALLLLEETQEEVLADERANWPISAQDAMVPSAWPSEERISQSNMGLVLHEPGNEGNPIGRIAACPAHLVNFSRRLLAIGSPSVLRELTEDSRIQISIDSIHRGDARRKSEQWDDAQSLYRLALRLLLAGKSELGPKIVTLNGLGIVYRTKAKAQLRADLIRVRESASSFKRELILPELVFHAMSAGALRLAWQAKACHILALDLAIESSNIASQANQVANVATVEQVLGNLDSARRYLCWAKQVHEGLGRTASVAVDDQMLASIEKELGRAGIKELHT